MTRLAEKIGKQVKVARQKGGLTVETLAVSCNISKGYLSDVENGKKLPSLVVLDRIARQLDISLHTLVQ